MNDEGPADIYDQYYFLHSNHIILFGLSPKHDLFSRIKDGTLDPTKIAIDFARKR